MKYTKNNIFNLFALVILMTVVIISCSKEENDLTFGSPTTFFKIGNEDTLTAPSVVYFNNASKNVDSYQWSFPNGKLIENNQVTDQEEFIGIEPDGVYYGEPGSYSATLTTSADGTENSQTINFTVLKPQPNITFNVPAIKFQEPVTFSTTVYAYPGKENDITYNWDFGDGQTSTQKEPTVTFEKPGVFTVTLVVNDTQEELTVTREIEVKGELAPTLYFTDAATDKLWTKKLFVVANSEPEVTDLSLGFHPLGVAIHENTVVVTEAGANLQYAAWGTPSDGRIIKSNLQGQNMKVITTTDEGGNAYVRDPFSCDVDEEGNLYWLNRFEGIRTLPIVSENAEYPAVSIALLAADIGESSTYGWTDGDVKIIDGDIWYSKHGSGKGLYVYNKDGSYKTKIDGLASIKIRSFDVDLENLKIYFALNIESGGFTPGLYVSDMNGENITLIDELSNFSTEGGAAERTYITDMVMDTQNGYIYYPFRDASDIDDSGSVIGDGSSSGIKRYKLDQSEAPEFYIQGFIPYGVAIDKENR
ncbi:PKD domain-containing protein [Portibacter lacus]|uniref:PKD domain-containing protein n=1 Tax=Portibacter lacus TaxID=1099794 RepID=A0AA37SS77_9BACT|nr:PKD domain-containing protein [Portibacter lacus]GLR19307.1 hypothetical protein GCM10007940_39230 [Portibacter lacus]